jgi:hypothetical protein
MKCAGRGAREGEKEREGARAREGGRETFIDNQERTGRNTLGTRAGVP